MGSLDRNRADHLDRLVDDPTAAAPADLRPLADLAADLRRSLSPAAEPARRGQLWARLAPRLEAVRTAPRPSWRPALRPAYALASLAAVLVLGLGTTTAFASAAALPGDALYPVKRGLEAAELALSRDDAALTAAFADRRLAEIESLSALGRWTDIAPELPRESTHRWAASGGPASHRDSRVLLRLSISRIALSTRALIEMPLLAA